MNTLRTFFLAVAVAVSGAATAALELTIEWVELDPAEFSAPANEADRVSLAGSQRDHRRAKQSKESRHFHSDPCAQPRAQQERTNQRAMSSPRPGLTPWAQL